MQKNSIIGMRSVQRHGQKVWWKWLYFPIFWSWRWRNSMNHWTAQSYQTSNQFFPRKQTKIIMSMDGSNRLQFHEKKYHFCLHYFDRFQFHEKYKSCHFCLHYFILTDFNFTRKIVNWHYSWLLFYFQATLGGLFDIQKPLSIEIAQAAKK